MKAVVLGAALGAVLLLTACGSKTAAQSGPPPVTVAAKCGLTGRAPLTSIWLAASDGTPVYAAEGGTGDVGVVLAPESPPGNVCDWLPYVRTLERAGLRVTAFDFRGSGDSPVPDGAKRQAAYDEDFAAAIARLRHEGAKKVVVVGASLGGARAMLYGPKLDADAIVSLSGEAYLPQYGVDARPAVRRIHVPLLIVGSRFDSYLPVPDAVRLVRSAGTKDKATAFFPGGWHGWDIVQRAPYAARARAVILRWIRAHTR